MLIWVYPSLGGIVVDQDAIHFDNLSDFSRVCKTASKIHTKIELKKPLTKLESEFAKNIVKAHQKLDDHNVSTLKYSVILAEMSKLLAIDKFLNIKGISRKTFLKKIDELALETEPHRLKILLKSSNIGKKGSKSSVQNASDNWQQLGYTVSFENPSKVKDRAFEKIRHFLESPSKEEKLATFLHLILDFDKDTVEQIIFNFNEKQPNVFQPSNKNYNKEQFFEKMVTNSSREMQPLFDYILSGLKQDEFDRKESINLNS